MRCPNSGPVRPGGLCKSRDDWARRLWSFECFGESRKPPGLSSRFCQSFVLELPALPLNLLDLAKHLTRLLWLIQLLIVPGQMVVGGRIARAQHCGFFKQRDRLSYLAGLFVHLSEFDVGVGKPRIQANRP